MDEPAQEKILSIVSYIYINYKLYIIKFNNCFGMFLKSPLFNLRDLIHNPDRITKLIREILPSIEKDSKEYFNIKLSRDYDSVYDSFISILMIIETYLDSHPEKKFFLPKLNINNIKPREILKCYKGEEETDNKVLTNKEICTDEEIFFSEFLIILGYLSNHYKESMLEYVEKLEENAVNYFLAIVDTFLKYDNMEEIAEVDENFNNTGNYMTNDNESKRDGSENMLHFAEDYKLSTRQGVDKNNRETSREDETMRLCREKLDKIKNFSTKSIKKINLENQYLFSKRSSFNISKYSELYIYILYLLL